ncbi:MAG: hypothetical protein M1820_010247 [Bogoriella megaspora]|nr:MAG: hypothetical protein M1820_010247 [Bogoriella megaspora]
MSDQVTGPMRIGQTATPTDRERLRQYFLNQSTEDQLQRWNELWQMNYTPWDRAGPSPALTDTLKERRDLLPAPLIDSQRRRKVLVPGCGAGYDVLLFASSGYDVYGLETSEEAIKKCKESSERADQDYPVWDSQIGRGMVNWILGDFFKDEWAKDANGQSLQFDIIYDYTFLSALPPSLRPAWALRLSQLLGPGHATLICLEFPTYKEPSTGGPPWGLPPEVYLQHLSRPGEDIPYDESGYVVEQAPAEDNEKALKRIAHWKAERTHQVGQGTDNVSIWRHR